MAADFLAVVFFAADFFAGADFLVAAFLAAGLFVLAFLTVVFLAGALCFLAVVADFFTNFFAAVPVALDPDVFAAVFDLLADLGAAEPEAALLALPGLGAAEAFFAAGTDLEAALRCPAEGVFAAVLLGPAADFLGALFFFVAGPASFRISSAEASPRFAPSSMLSVSSPVCPSLPPSLPLRA
ncbi:MAG: hypothetical protein JO217_02335 [Acidobacteriaceae bacterium]|nr:hypothetical protein [Acidobacteriaceae bacterium]MBV9441511.1 hypothetical protein [Acidobacteriaceae bacterium]